MRLNSLKNQNRLENARFVGISALFKMCFNFDKFCFETWIPTVEVIKVKLQVKKLPRRLSRFTLCGLVIFQCWVVS